MMVLDIRGKATCISWYEIWEAELAVVSMCVHALGKGGKAINIGEYNCFNETIKNSLFSFL